MAFWRTFHTVNENVVFILGFTLNVLLLIVIKKVKVKAMQKYNVLLIQCCCVDLFQIFISIIVRPVTMSYNNNVYFLTNGFLRRIGGHAEMLGICLWVTSVCFCVCSMPISYVFRYRMMCLKSEISVKFYVISLVLTLPSASAVGAIVWKFHYINNHNLLYLAENGFSWLMADDEGKVKAASICPAVSLNDFKCPKAKTVRICCRRNVIFISKYIDLL